MQRSPFVLLRGKRRVSLAVMVWHACAFAASSQLAQTEQSISEPSALLLEEPPEDFPTRLLLQWEMSFGVLSFVVLCLPRWLCWQVLYTNLSPPFPLSYMQTNKNQLTSIQTLFLFTTLLLNLKIQPSIQSSQCFTHNWDGSSKIYSKEDFLIWPFFPWTKIKALIKA